MFSDKSSLISVRHTELLQDWIKVKKPNFTIPDASGWENIGTVLTSECKWSVMRAHTSGEETLCLLAPDGTDTVAHLGMLEWSRPVMMAKNAMTNNNYAKRGLMTALFDFACKKLGYILFSDFEMSADGEQLWCSIIKNSATSIVPYSGFKNG